MSDHPQILFESVTQLREWLSKHHKQASSIWLVKWKIDAGRPFISYDEIVDQLICYGWVDSLPRKLNAEQTMLRISPRNPKSNWSGVNKKRVARLVEVGLMEAAGMELIEQAKANGAWTFLDEVEQLIIPLDLAEALARYPRAAHYFDRFPRSSKRGILEWIKNAKQSITRTKRIEETATKAAQNRKANHPKGRDAGPVEK